MTVGLVGAGHMGAGLGWALREGGARVVTSLEGRSARTARLAADAGIDVLPALADVLRTAEVVLVVTPPGMARAAATDIASAAEASGARPLVADLNAIAPSTVDDIAATIAPLDLVDGSISGAPPRVRPGARIYLSGPRAAAVAGLPWRHVHNGGLEPVAAVALAAAKAARFVPEMREIAATQAGAGLTAALFEAYAQLWERIARSPLAAQDPEGVDASLGADEVVRGITPPAP